MRFHKVGRCVCLLLALCVSSDCGILSPSKQRNANTTTRETNARPGKSDDTLYYLEISSPSIRQPIEPLDDRVGAARFVQVEVAEVVNQKKYELTFKVDYQPLRGAKIYLGSFSLYPADNPGKFIVATQGKVKNEGAIVLSMVIDHKVSSQDTVRVGIKKIKLISGRPNPG